MPAYTRSKPQLTNKTNQVSKHQEASGQQHPEQPWLLWGHGKSRASPACAVQPWEAAGHPTNPTIFFLQSLLQLLQKQTAFWCSVGCSFTFSCLPALAQAPSRQKSLGGILLLTLFGEKVQGQVNTQCHLQAEACD